MYNNAYPWQILKNTNMELNFRLSLKIDKNKLPNESKLIIQKFAPKAFWPLSVWLEFYFLLVLTVKFIKVKK